MKLTDDAPFLGVLIGVLVVFAVIFFIRYVL